MKFDINKWICMIYSQFTSNGWTVSGISSWTWSTYFTLFNRRTSQKNCFYNMVHNYYFNIVFIIMLSLQCHFLFIICWKYLYFSLIIFLNYKTKFRVLLIWRIMWNMEYSVKFIKLWPYRNSDVLTTRIYSCNNIANISLKFSFLKVLKHQKGL